MIELVRRRPWIAVVPTIVALVIAGAGWRALRAEPANTGPPPTLPEYATPTSLAPDNDVVAGAASEVPQTTVVDADEETDTTSSTAEPAEEPTPTGPTPTIVVQPDGSGDYVLLREAIAAAVPGDVIEVHGGEWGRQRIDQNGGPGAWLRIVAAPGTRPIIRTAGEGSGFELDRASYVEIDGFEIIGPSETRSGAGVRIVNNTHHVRVENNVIHNFPGNGVEVIESGSVAVIGNEIFNNSRRSPFQTSGISFFKPWGDDGDGFENIVSGNIVYDNENLVPNQVHGITDGNCVIIDNTRWPAGDYEYPGETLIENNVCFDNGGRGIHVLKADDVYVVNNTLYRNLRTESIQGGELSADDARNVLFRNNLVWPRLAEDGVRVARSESVGFDNNAYVVAPGTDSGLFEESAVLLADAGFVNADIDPSTADFRPLPDSAVVGAGSPEGAPPVDFAGVTRPTTPSLGALEPEVP